MPTFHKHFRNIPVSISWNKSIFHKQWSNEAISHSPFPKIETLVVEHGIAFAQIVRLMTWFYCISYLVYWFSPISLLIAGERLIQYASENLVTEILIHPQYNTLIQCMRNMLSSFTRHRHIIHAGYTFSGNGSWILQVITFIFLYLGLLNMSRMVLHNTYAYHVGVHIDRDRLGLNS